MKRAESTGERKHFTLKIKAAAHQCSLKRGFLKRDFKRRVQAEEGSSGRKVKRGPGVGLRAKRCLRNILETSFTKVVVTLVGKLEQERVNI